MTLGHEVKIPDYVRKRLLKSMDRDHDGDLT